jgi:hypothetical protein
MMAYCRYKADLSTRDSRLSELQEKWFKQQLQGSPITTGPTGRVPAAPLAPEQRDMQQALLWFRQLGWEVQEQDGESITGENQGHNVLKCTASVTVYLLNVWLLGSPVFVCYDHVSADDCEDLLAALIQRARAYKQEVEKLHDKATAAAAATGAAQAAAAAAAVGEPQIAWQSKPWRCGMLTHNPCLGFSPITCTPEVSRPAAGDDMLPYLHVQGWRSLIVKPGCCAVTFACMLACLLSCLLIHFFSVLFVLAYACVYSLQR